MVQTQTEHGSQRRQKNEWTDQLWGANGSGNLQDGESAERDHSSSGHRTAFQTWRCAEFDLYGLSVCVCHLYILVLFILIYMSILIYSFHTFRWLCTWPRLAVSDIMRSGGLHQPPNWVWCEKDLHVFHPTGNSVFTVLESPAALAVSYWVCRA